MIPSLAAPATPRQPFPPQPPYPPQPPPSSRVARYAWLKLDAVKETVEVASSSPPVPAGGGDASTSATPAGRTTRSFVWQAPPHQPPWGVALIVRGSGHAEDDHGWPASASCPGCTWKPEERGLVAATLAGGLIALSIAPLRSCPDAEADAPLVAAALGRLRARAPAAFAAAPGGGLPLFATGSSAGARVVARLHAVLPPALAPAAVAPACGCVDPGDALSPPPGMAPSLWVHMPRDQALSACVADDVAALKAAGRVAETYAVFPIPVGPTFFSDRIDGVEPAASFAAHAALLAAGLLDAGWLLTEQPPSHWGRGGRALPAAWAAAAPALLNASADDPRVERFDYEANSHAALVAAFAFHAKFADAQPDVVEFFRRFAPGGGAG